MRGWNSLEIHNWHATKRLREMDESGRVLNQYGPGPIETIESDLLHTSVTGFEISTVRDRFVT